MTIKTLKTRNVLVGTRLRKTDSKKVDELAQSIMEIGLQQPIVINKQNELLDGFHRLLAHEKLALKFDCFKEIECIIQDSQDMDAELIEIDTTLMKAELNVIDRGNFLKRRKEIYDIKYPKAEKTGVSQRSVQTDIQIATNLTPEVKEAIKTTDLVNKKVELTELSKLGPEQQKEFVKEYEQGKIEKVVEILNKEFNKEELIEREFETFKKELDKLINKYPINHLIFEFVESHKLK